MVEATASGVAAPTALEAPEAPQRADVGVQVAEGAADDKEAEADPLAELELERCDGAEAAPEDAAWLSKRLLKKDWVAKTCGYTIWEDIEDELCFHRRRSRALSYVVRALQRLQGEYDDLMAKGFRLQEAYAQECSTNDQHEGYMNWYKEMAQYYHEVAKAHGAEVEPEVPAPPEAEEVDDRAGADSEEESSPPRRRSTRRSPLATPTAPDAPAAPAAVATPVAKQDSPSQPCVGMSMQAAAEAKSEADSRCLAPPAGTSPPSPLLDLLSPARSAAAAAAATPPCRAEASSGQFGFPAAPPATATAARPAAPPATASPPTRATSRSGETGATGASSPSPRRRHRPSPERSGKRSGARSGSPPPAPYLPAWLQPLSREEEERGKQAFNKHQEKHEKLMADFRLHQSKGKLVHAHLGLGDRSDAEEGADDEAGDQRTSPAARSPPPAGGGASSSGSAAPSEAPLAAPAAPAPSYWGLRAWASSPSASPPEKRPSATVLQGWSSSPSASPPEKRPSSTVLGGSCFQPREATGRCSPPPAGSTAAAVAGPPARSTSPARRGSPVPTPSTLPLGGGGPPGSFKVPSWLQPKTAEAAAVLAAAGLWTPQCEERTPTGEPVSARSGGSVRERVSSPRALGSLPGDPRDSHAGPRRLVRRALFQATTIPDAAECRPLAAAVAAGPASAGGGRRPTPTPARAGAAATPQFGTTSGRAAAGVCQVLGSASPSPSSRASPSSRQPSKGRRLNLGMPTRRH